MLAGAAAVVGLAGCWPVPGQGPDRQAHNPIERVITPATVATLGEDWTVDTGDGPVGPPLVSAAQLVHVVTPRTFYALGLRDGHEVWSKAAPVGEAFDPQPAAMGDTPDVNTGSGRVGVAYTDPNTAHRIWWLDAATGSGDATTGPGGGTIEGIRGQWGLTVQRFADSTWYDVALMDGPGVRYGGPIGPAVGPGRFTLGEAALFQAGRGIMSLVPTVPTPLGNAVRAYPRTYRVPPGQLGDRVCGTDLGLGYWVICPIWATPVDGGAWTDPVLTTDQSTVFVGTDAGTLYALDAVTGAVRWTAGLGAPITASPALAGDTLYVPTGSGRLHALPAGGCGTATCSPAWSAVGGGPLRVQPAVAGGVVFTAADNGRVRAFDAAGCGARRCEALWKAELGSRVTGAPAVELGRLFLGTEDGRVVAFRPGASA